MKKHKLFILMVLTLSLFISCSKVTKGGYADGKQRAISDFKFNNYVFPVDEGYYPAAALKNKTAYLYEKAPYLGWSEKPRLSQEYISDWFSGYTDYCIKKGYKVKTTEDKAPLLGHESIIKNEREPGNGE